MNAFDKTLAEAKTVKATPTIVYDHNCRAEELVKYALRFIADLNGSEWIQGDGAGEVDMRQRATQLHEELSQHVYPR
jgi:hypothetical protein